MVDLCSCHLMVVPGEKKPSAFAGSELAPHNRGLHGACCDLHVGSVDLECIFQGFLLGDTICAVTFSLLCCVYTGTQLDFFPAALQGLAVCPGKVMDSRGEMEVVRSSKGSAAGEVSVHVVTTESTVQSTHLPTTAFIIPGMWSSPLHLLPPQPGQPTPLVELCSSQTLGGKAKLLLPS